MPLGVFKTGLFAASGFSSISDDGGGYTGGNNIGSPGSSTDVEKLGFPSETTSVVATWSSTIGYLYGPAGLSNSRVAGYHVGGSGASGRVASAQKHVFGSSSTSTLAAAVTHARNSASGMSSKNYGKGFEIGGDDVTNYGDHANRLTFSSDTFSHYTSFYAYRVRQATSCANQSTAGYTFGGYGNNGSVWDTLQTVFKTQFSTESTSLLSTTIATGVQNNLGSLANNGTAAYSCGGYPYSATISKMPFSTETCAAISATFSGTGSALPYGVRGLSDTGVAGYFGAAPTTDHNKITFSSDTLSLVAHGHTHNSHGSFSDEAAVT